MPPAGPVWATTSLAAAMQSDATRGRRTAGQATSQTGAIMIRAIAAALALGMLIPLTGCPELIGFLQPNSTTVRLINNSDFDVDVVLYYDEDQNVLDSLIDDAGTRVEYTLAPGETQQFSRDCDDLQAIKIVDADLRVVGQIGPQASTDVFRDGDDFGCNDTITFTFDHSAILIDFDVSVAFTN
jgi:hypothetical protein